VWYDSGWSRGMPTYSSMLTGVSHPPLTHTHR
jgi:hypothetical protein